MSRTRVPVALAAVTALSACDPDPAAVVCTEEARPAVVVEVRHAVTGEPAAEGAVLFLVDGDFVEVVDETTVGGLFLWGATERPGRYDVRVEKEGFRAWEREGVEVPTTADGCHVVTVHLEASLEPETRPSSRMQLHPRIGASAVSRQSGNGDVRPTDSPRPPVRLPRRPPSGTTAATRARPPRARPAP